MSKKINYSGPHQLFDSFLFLSKLKNDTEVMNNTHINRIYFQQLLKKIKGSSGGPPKIKVDTHDPFLSHRELKRLLNFWKPRKTPRVINTTVCISTLGRAQELSRALQALHNQTLPFSNILIAWDGTPIKEALNFEKKIDKNKYSVEFYHYKKQMGPGKRRNQLAQKARTDWLMFFDDDNIAFNFLNSHHSYLASKFNVDMVTSSRLVFSKDPRNVTAYIPSLGPDRIQGFFRGVMGDTVFTIRKKSFEKMGGFTENIRIPEDYDFHIRAALKKLPWIASPSATYLYKKDKSRRSYEIHSAAISNNVAKKYSHFLNNDWSAKQLKGLRLLGNVQISHRQQLYLSDIIKMSRHVAS